MTLGQTPLKPPTALLLWLVDSILLFGSYVFVAYQVPQVDGEFYLFYDNGLLQIAVLTLVLQVALSTQLLYRTVLVRSRVILLMKLCWVVGIAFLYQAFGGYVLPSLILPRSVMFYGSLLVVIVLPAGRAAFAAVLRQTAAPKRVLFLGSSPTLQVMARRASKEDTNFTVAGYVDAQPQDVPLSAPDLGPVEDIEAILAAHHPQHLVISSQWKGHLLLRNLLDLQWSGLGMETAEAFYESLLRRVSLLEVRASELLLSSQRPSLLSELSPVVALLALIVTSPLFCLAAVMVACSKKEGAKKAMLAREQRLGLGGKVFTLFRFRVPAGMPGRIWFLRSGLYRLPELVNVLRGDLAFFGPPPERPEFLPVLSRHIPCYPFLLAVKPGILGWSQVNVSQPMEGVVTRLEYDFYYIKRRTVALDTYIAIHSLLGEGTPAPAPQS